MMRPFRLAPVLLASLVLTACPEKKVEPVKPPEPVKPVPPPALPPEPEERAPKECAAPLEPGPESPVTIAGRAAKVSGYKLTFSEPAKDGKLTLGVLGPINEDSGQNMFVMKKYLKFFQDEGVSAIVVTGDSGEIADGIARVLTALADAKVPVLVLAGNRECRAEYTDGVNQAKKDTAVIANMNELRMVEFPEATLISLPGYHDPNYINCKFGCQYYKSTLDEVVKLGKEAKTPAVLVSHGPPRGTSKLALDAATPGENVGDPEVNRVIQQGNIPFGLFSNIKEAGGRGASDAAGTALVAEKSSSKTLYFAAGPADTVPWEMNDGNKNMGMASIFTVKGGEASFKNLRLKALTAAEKAEAKKLDPPARAEKPEEAAPAPGGAAPTPAPGGAAPAPAPPPGQPAGQGK